MKVARSDSSFIVNEGYVPNFAYWYGGHIRLYICLASWLRITWNRGEFPKVHFGQRWGIRG